MEAVYKLKKSLKLLSTVFSTFLILSNKSAFAGGSQSKIPHVKTVAITPMARAELDKIKQAFDHLPDQRKKAWRETLSVPIDRLDYVNYAETVGETRKRPSLSRTQSKKALALTGSLRDPQTYPVLAACSDLKIRIVRLILAEPSPQQQMSIVAELCTYFGYDEIIKGDPEIVSKINLGQIERVFPSLNPLNGVLEIKCTLSMEKTFTVSI